MREHEKKHGMSAHGDKLATHVFVLEKRLESSLSTLKSKVFIFSVMRRVTFS
jgi:hypothetical protein